MCTLTVVPGPRARYQRRCSGGSPSLPDQSLPFPKVDQMCVLTPKKGWGSAVSRPLPAGDLVA